MQNPYTEAALGPLFLRTALPMVAIMSVNGLHAVVDAAFLGAYVGPDALSAVTLIFPALMAMVALQALVSGGMASLLARRLGARQREEARGVFGSAHLLALGFVALLYLLYFAVLAPHIATLAGGEGQVAEGARRFLGVTVLGSPVAFLLSLSIDALRCEGRVRFMALITIASSLLNMLANWLLIGWAGLGVQGSALGTVLAQAVCLTVILVERRRGGSRLTPVFGFRPADMGRILAIGGPMSLGFLGMSLGSAAVLYNVSVWSAGEARLSTVAAYGVITRILTFAYLPLMGMSIAFQTICGSNYGARLGDRVEGSLRIALTTAFAYSFAIELLAILGRGPIAGIFTEDAAVVAEISRILPWMVAAYVLFGPTVTLAGYYQAIGDAGRAALFSLSRSYLLFMPLTFLLPRILGEAGIWRAPLLADLAVAAMALAILWRDRRRHGWRYGLVRS